MNIQLASLKPDVFDGTDRIGPSEVWGQEIEFASRQRTLISATSGSGKTFLTTSLCGLCKAFKGEILIDGEPSRTFKLDQWAELRQRRLAIIFQELFIFPQLTGSANIKIKADLSGSHSIDEVRSMADRLGVLQVLEKKCGKMSMGERQRIAILRALVQPFELLLMDEPFSHLDEDNILRACKLIDEVCQQREAGFILTSLGDAYGLEIDQRYRL